MKSVTAKSSQVKSTNVGLVQWSDKSTDEAAFQLQRCGPSAAASCTNFANLAKVASTTAAGVGKVYSHTDGSLRAGKFYCYRVQACKRSSACSAPTKAMCMLAK
jgi:hypothetical protein